MTALAVARAEAPGVPFIFLSGTIGEERAIEALKCGAIDYVLKSNPKRLVPAVERALQDAELRRTSQLAEQQVARLTGVLQMLSGINSALVRIQTATRSWPRPVGSRILWVGTGLRCWP